MRASQMSFGATVFYGSFRAPINGTNGTAGRGQAMDSLGTVIWLRSIPSRERGNGFLKCEDVINPIFSPPSSARRRRLKGTRVEDKVVYRLLLLTLIVLITSVGTGPPSTILA
jgi:hypothetical protein